MGRYWALKRAGNPTKPGMAASFRGQLDAEGPPYEIIAEWWYGGVPPGTFISTYLLELPGYTQRAYSLNRYISSTPWATGWNPEVGKSYVLVIARKGFPNYQSPSWTFT